MMSLLGDVQLGHKNQSLRYPLVICYIAIEHGDLQLMDLPIENCDFPGQNVNLPKGTFPLNPIKSH